MVRLLGLTLKSMVDHIPPVISPCIRHIDGRHVGSLSVRGNGAVNERG